MSELRQYHPSLRVLQINQVKNGWIFIGDTPKDFAILQSETKMKQVFGPKVKLSLPKLYHSVDASESDFVTSLIARNTIVVVVLVGFLTFITLKIRLFNDTG